MRIMYYGNTFLSCASLAIYWLTRMALSTGNKSTERKYLKRKLEDILDMAANHPLRFEEFMMGMLVLLRDTEEALRIAQGKEVDRSS